ncbi:MAG: TIGR00282 family metallophosphoesterase [Spirochaetaceae bacterium]|jgi:metallophosphoesterase (TIGR00282 family)|nr:TIGR00282 family metallophosphoesterase [Spirochaetaceae bacterium]
MNRPFQSEGKAERAAGTACGGILMVGDVVGESGLAALESLLPALKADYRAALAVVNGENAADGIGMTEVCAQRIFAAGADVITTGNHIWEKRDFLPLLDSDSRILRPFNYPAGAVGHGSTLIEREGFNALVINLQGREYMHAIDCPFKAFDALDESLALAHARPIIIVDFHAESAQEKEALAFYLDGRATVVAGTHTHVQTADERILPQGTAYITDLGMCGARESVIGMDMTVCLNRIKTHVPYKMEAAKGAGFIQGIAVHIDAASGKALSIERWKRQ